MGPGEYHLHQLGLEALHIFILAERQFALLRYFGDDPRLCLDFAERSCELFLWLRCLLALLLEDEATEQGRALLGRQFVEESVEEQFAQQELVARADLARHARLQLNHVGLVDEPQATENSLSTFQLVELHDR